MHFTDVELLNSIERFWKVEDLSLQINHLSEEDKFCERFYKETTTRQPDGRFVVKMPRSQKYLPVFNSKQLAVKRLYSLEARFKREPFVKQQYVDFLEEYEALDHMRVVSKEDNEASYEINYLSHHPVWKNEETKEKIRVVFNGSSPDPTGNTLNNTLLLGPPVSTNLFKTISNFRLHSIAVTADIEKNVSSNSYLS